jgi:hypothetical protein
MAGVGALWAGHGELTGEGRGRGRGERRGGVPWGGMGRGRAVGGASGLQPRCYYCSLALC